MTIAGLPVGRAQAVYRDTISQRETVNVMGDGTVRNRTSGEPDELLEFALPRLDNSTWTTLKSLLLYYKKINQSFAIVDDYGTSYTVRYWGENIQGEHRLGRFWSTKLVFRVES